MALIRYVRGPLLALALTGCASLSRAPVPMPPDWGELPWQGTQKEKSASSRPDSPEGQQGKGEPETRSVPTGSAPTAPSNPDDRAVGGRPAAAPTADSEDRYGPSRTGWIFDTGVALVQDRISGGSVSGFTDTTLIINPNVGYLLYDNIELGLGVSGEFNFLEGADDVTSVTTRLFANYIHRASNRLWIQGGPNFGLQITDEGPVSDVSPVVGAQGGIRYWLGANVAISTMLNWRYLFDQEFLNIATNQIEEFDSSSLRLTFGFVVGF